MSVDSRPADISRPQAEAIYEALFDLYDSPNGPPDAAQQWQRLMNRMLGSIPQSRIARLKRAEWLVANGRQDQAEALLKSLLAEIVPYLVIVL